MDDMGVEVERIDKTAHLKSLPESVRRRLAGMDTVHKEFLKVQLAYRDELDALRRKYMMMYAPIFHRRAALLSGEAEPSAEELVDYTPSPDAPSSAVDAGVRGVPYFWYHALMNNSRCRELLGMSDRDKEALKYLVDISVENLPRTPDKISPDDDIDSGREDLDDGEEERSVIRTGYKLIFTFQPNPFFSDTVLTKTYHMHEDDASGEQLYDNTEATKPNWFPGKDLTVHLVKKTQRARTRGGRNKRASGASRIVTVEEPCPSFFNFFSPPDIACAAEMSSEDFEITSQLLHEDWSAGNIIKKDIIPLALLWYRGECDDDDEGEEEEFTDDEDGDEDEDGEEDRNSDEDDEDDDDEDGGDMGAARDTDRNGGDGGRMDSQKPLPATAGETPQECKQQ